MDQTITPHPVHSVDRLVYLVTQDSHFSSFLSRQITHFGYYVQQVRDLSSLERLIADHNSVAILVDIPAEAGETGGGRFIEEFRPLQQISSRLIFTSDRDSQAIRLKSIQAGGTAFFTKPLNIVSLVDRLDSLNRTILPPQASRVLIVEEQPSVASYYQMVLRMAGMESQIVQNPGSLLEQLQDYHPELILMDTFTSEIHALDLARVIRQIDDYVSVPIIFLFGEDDFDKRIEALDVGGDDFLVKPIKASHLISVVRSRLERSKKLRSYMVRDSLTNLLNHTTFRSLLSQEINRSRRQNTELALAMLDIDHFKQVNDRYGHAVGDSVLKGLSRLLQQRLRNYDNIGRYGGDELVALLVGCAPYQAQKIMDEIRTHFSEIQFCPEQSRPLTLTFSCGISVFPKYQSAEALSDSADQALYRAKAQGRDRVVVIA